MKYVTHFYMIALYRRFLRVFMEENFSLHKNWIYMKGCGMNIFSLDVIQTFMMRYVAVDWFMRCTFRLLISGLYIFSIPPTVK